MRKLIGTWNPTRGMWETGTLDLLSEHSEPFSETWPTWGMTRSGVAFELPTRVPHMDASESSLLRTPVADETGGGPLHPDTAKERGQTLRLTGQILARTGHLLPTPNTSSGTGPGAHGTGGPNLQTVLLPTPAAMNPNDGESFDTWEARRLRVKATGKNGNGFGTPLAIAVQLLPTPKASDGEFVSGSTSGRPVEKSTHLGTIALLQAGHLEHRRTGADTNPRSEGGSA